MRKILVIETVDWLGKILHHKLSDREMTKGCYDNRRLYNLFTDNR